MARTIADIIAALTPDTRRSHIGFDPDFAAANGRMLEAKPSQVPELLREWLSRHQPCLFGRLGAKKGLLSFCILSDEELVQGDEAVRDRIQAARLQWKKDAHLGRKSGFIVLAVSRKVAEAEPNTVLQEFARRLCQLYLEVDCPVDEILFDDIFLEAPGHERAVWKWVTGVNVFAAAADRRWWQDHRIPGGLGFSVNSVGHMVKSSQLSVLAAEIEKTFGIGTEPFAQEVVDELPKALDFAMRTILKASDAVSGKATMLLPDPGDLPAKCPVELSPVLRGKNYCEYAGYYHTDVTIPSIYFTPDVQRPASAERIPLDFTYLFRNEVDNPAFQTMGVGRRVRGGVGKDVVKDKAARAEPSLVTLDSETQLAQALRTP
jgi:hypothetical protein